MLQRIEAVNFGWSSKSPGPGVNINQFPVRWSGMVEATSTGNFRFQTSSNDGVRLWINGKLVINNWTNHATVTDTTGNIVLTKNQRCAITIEFYDAMDTAEVRLRPVRQHTQP